MASLFNLVTPFGGVIRIEFDGAQLLDLDWRLESVHTPNSAAPLPPGIATLVAQLRAYCADPQHRFDWSLPNGTPYQRRVWQCLQSIPAGQTRSYGELARELDSGPRAVAAACRANPYPILVPCHRVVAIHDLGGYCGSRAPAWLNLKRALLRHEGWRDG